MSLNWRETPEHSTTGFSPILPESYFMKRDLLTRPDPDASGVTKRPRVGPEPQIHEVICGVMKKSRAILKSGLPSCVPPFQALTYLQNNNVQYSQSDDLQTIINKMVEIECKLESIVQKSDKREEKPNEYQDLLSQIITVFNQIGAKHLPNVSANQVENSKANVQELLNACNVNFRGVGAENALNSIQELFRKLNPTNGMSSTNAPAAAKSAPRRIKSKKIAREKRKFDSQIDFEPMIEDSDIDVTLNRPMLHPRKIVFAFQPQNSMEVE